jgi:hypothetical protein
MSAAGNEMVRGQTRIIQRFFQSAQATKNISAVNVSAQSREAFLGDARGAKIAV